MLGSGDRVANHCRWKKLRNWGRFHARLQVFAQKEFLNRIKNQYINHPHPVHKSHPDTSSCKQDRPDYTTHLLQSAVEQYSFLIRVPHLLYPFDMTTTTPASSTTIDRAQAQKAVDALLKHHEKVSAEREETELIGREEHVWLVVNTKRGTTKRKMMPKRM